MIYTIKELLGITDTSKDNVINHYMSKSQNAIKTYCNIDEIPEEYNPSIIDLAIFYYKNRNNEGISQQSQGSRSQSFEKGIPESIKASLPLPKVKVIG